MTKHFLTPQLEQNWHLYEKDNMWFVQDQRRCRELLIAIRIEDNLFFRGFWEAPYVFGVQKATMKAMERDGFDFDKIEIFPYRSPVVEGIFNENWPTSNWQYPSRHDYYTYEKLIK